MLTTMNIAIAAAVLVIILFVFASYVKAPPSTAFIISGISREPRVLIGKGGFKIPFFERLDKVYLGQISCDVKTDAPVPTNDFVNVNVDSVIKVRVKPDPEGIRLAAKNFLNMPPQQIITQLQDSLQGNLRECIGVLPLKELNINRDRFSDQVSTKASPDMAKLGIEILTCNIQNVTDKENVIYSLGIDNISQIKKDASIAKANADKEVAVETSRAQKVANDARVEAESAIAERNNELAVKVAKLKVIEDTQKANADAAYEIQKQEMNKTINVKTVDAEIERTNREQELALQRAKMIENELQGTVNKQADADRYKAETAAQANLKVKQQEAEAIKALGEAEAARIRLTGNAEAEVIRSKALAEAEGLKMKADAFNANKEATLGQMIIELLPAIAKEVAAPISAIKAVNIYGGDSSGINDVSSNVPVVMKQVFDTVQSATGVDLGNIMMGNSKDARVQRKIDVNGNLSGSISHPDTVE